MPIVAPALLRSSALAAVLCLALTGCGTTAPGGDGTDGNTAGGGGSEVSRLDCSGVVTEGWGLFVDPRLTIDPASDVVPLTKAGENISFVDTAPVGWTTYSYTLGYIDDEGQVFVNAAEIFVGAEHTQTFQLEGPVAPSSVDGGPYAGILQIEASDDSGTTPLARICVQLALAE